MLVETRIIQAERYWDLSVGLELGFVNFKAYLKTIPKISEALFAADFRFPLLILVEPRIGLTKLCRLGNINFPGDDKTFVLWSDEPEYKNPTSPVWIRMQDGSRNRNYQLRGCRPSFMPDELGLTALEGVCSYIECPAIIKDIEEPDAHNMDLAGSVHRDYYDLASYLSIQRGRAYLLWRWSGQVGPMDGLASRRK